MRVCSHPLGGLDRDGGERAMLDRLLDSTIGAAYFVSGQA